jgi:hypothetical protein
VSSVSGCFGWGLLSPQNRLYTDLSLSDFTLLVWNFTAHEDITYSTITSYHSIAAISLLWFKYQFIRNTDWDMFCLFISFCCFDYVYSIKSEYVLSSTGSHIWMEMVDAYFKICVGTEKNYK